MRLDLSNDAEADLDEILSYSTEQFGGAIAEEYFYSFREAFDLLCAHPEAGAAIDAVDPGVRKLSHRRHRIYYEIEPPRVMVLRILHYAMDVPEDLGAQD